MDGNLAMANQEENHPDNPEKQKTQIEKDAEEYANSVSYGSGTMCKPHIVYAYIAGRTKGEEAAKLLDELVTMVENMHKPEYATFFDGERHLDGYQLAEMFREKINSP